MQSSTARRPLPLKLRFTTLPQLEHQHASGKPTTGLAHLPGTRKKGRVRAGRPDHANARRNRGLLAQSTDFSSDSDCNVGSPDLAANSLIDAIYLQFADYGGKARKDFDLCVLAHGSI